MADSEDFALSSLPIDVEELAVPVRLENLFPWHRPRKQFIRERQWRNNISHYIQKYVKKQSVGGTSDGNANFRYLTLAGIDYFDVEVISKTCAHHEVELTITNYLSTGKNSVLARANLRQQSLIETKKITDRSTLFSQRLEEICQEGSQAFREFERRGPYHAVNVDACGSITQGPKGRRVIDAIHKIIEVQLRYSTGDWLLFLTADARPENVDEDVLKQLCEAIRQNAKESEEFRVGALEMFDKSEADDLDATLKEASASEENFAKLFVLGLSKWLLHNGQGAHWDVEALDYYFYSTREGGENGAGAPSMPSLAFRFRKRMALIDPYSVVGKSPSAAASPVTDYSMQALLSSRGMQNLDVLMEQDKGLKAKLSTATYELLEQAGYEKTALEQYVLEHCQPGSMEFLMDVAIDAANGGGTASETWEN